MRHVEAIENILNGSSNSGASTSGTSASSPTSLDRTQIDRIKVHVAELRKLIGDAR